MTVTKIVEVKCPVCGVINDFISFRFNYHTDNKVFQSHDNPCDLEEVRMCPNLHVFDCNNELINGPKEIAHEYE